MRLFKKTIKWAFKFLILIINISFALVRFILKILALIFTVGYAGSRTMKY